MRIWIIALLAFAFPTLLPAVVSALCDSPDMSCGGAYCHGYDYQCVGGPHDGSCAMNPDECR